MKIPSICVVALSVCAVPAFADITVTSPASDATVAQPFPLMATATVCSSQPVVSMGYSLDHGTNVMTVKGASINTQVSAAVGSHVLKVKSWGKGTACVVNVPITVAAGPEIPPDAIAISGVHAMDTWKATFDTGTGSGSATGAMSMVSSPSLSGSARQFVTTYNNNGGERYSVNFGTDANATNFLYDGWVYPQSPTNDVANLEMDLNQVMPNGQTAIYAFQCSGWANTWEYTTNAGTPDKPVVKWLKSNQTCNPRAWTPNAWHHVQIQFSRDDAGNVTYHSVWLDGVEQVIDQTVPSAFALKWAPGAMVTNFQVDGAGTSGSATYYLDNLTIYRW